MVVFDNPDSRDRCSRAVEPIDEHERFVEHSERRDARRENRASVRLSINWSRR